MARRQLPVAIGVISSGAVDLDTVASIVTVLHEHTVRWVTLFRSGPYLDDARNAVVRTFMTDRQFRSCTHLLMVDSDIEFTPTDIEKLYDAQKPVVSGTYHHVHGSLMLPVVYDWAEDDEGHKGLAPVLSWPDGWPMWPRTSPDLDPVTEVTAAGAGFLMVERSVYRALGELHPEPLPFFAEEVRHDAHLGEDLCFCLRAQDAGFPTWVHRGVQVGHRKTMRLGGLVSD